MKAHTRPGPVGQSSTTAQTLAPRVADRLRLALATLFAAVLALIARCRTGARLAGDTATPLPEIPDLDAPSPVRGGATAGDPDPEAGDVGELPALDLPHVAPPSRPEDWQVTMADVDGRVQYAARAIRDLGTEVRSLAQEVEDGLTTGAIGDRVLALHAMASGLRMVASVAERDNEASCDLFDLAALVEPDPEGKPTEPRMTFHDAAAYFVADATIAFYQRQGAA